jgi:hypothetical protein
MQAIIPNRPARSRPYSWGNISVDPDPPRVGIVTAISFPLANLDVDDVIVERIETKVALFGMGVQWERLPAVGPFRLPPDPRHIEHATVEWVPRQGGHRCVHASIFVQGAEQVCQVGRNLQVIEATADEDLWRVPFRLGNPRRRLAQIHLAFGGNDPAALDVSVRLADRIVPLDRPITLRPGDEVAAELLLRAHTDGTLHHIRTVEALIDGALLDGIQVTVNRPARHAAGSLPIAPEEAAMREPAYAVAR